MSLYDFTPGMVVLVHRRHVPPIERTIAKVSPTGKVITLDNGERYTGDGREIGSSRYFGNHMEPLTDKVRARLAEEQAQKAESERRRLLSSQILAGIAHLNSAALERILAAIQQEQPE